MRLFSISCTVADTEAKTVMRFNLFEISSWIWGLSHYLLSSLLFFSFVKNAWQFWHAWVGLIEYYKPENTSKINIYKTIRSSNTISWKIDHQLGFHDRYKQLKNWLCYHADVVPLNISQMNLKISLIQSRHGMKFPLHDYEDSKYLVKYIWTLSNSPIMEG